jgi:hypothetical protein
MQTEPDYWWCQDASKKPTLRDAATSGAIVFLARTGGIVIRMAWA